MTTAWYALVGPPGLEKSIQEKINTDVTEALKDPILLKSFDDILLDPVGGSVAATSAFFEQENAKWESAIRAAAISPQK